MGTKPAYPYTEDQDEESDTLMVELQQITLREEQIKKRLRQIIYSVEKPK